MRKAVIFLLLAATAASPLAAQAWIGQGNGPDRVDRDPYRTDRIQNPRRDWREAERDRDGDAARRDDPRRPGWNDARRDGRDWNDARSRDDRGWDGRSPDRRGPDGRDPDYRAGWNDGRGRQWSDNGRGPWNSRWREDRRYDWQGYRAGNRAIYRAPRYYGPRGYEYSRWSRGYRVQPYFYGQNYWIADPWRYRLPPAYGSYRWVRYYDDVALIDIRSGLIEDIIYSFFWR